MLPPSILFKSIIAGVDIAKEVKHAEMFRGFKNTETDTEKWKKYCLKKSNMH